MNSPFISCTDLRKKNYFSFIFSLTTQKSHRQKQEQKNRIIIFFKLSIRDVLMKIS